MIPLATTTRFTLVAAAILTALVGSATAADLRGRAPVPYQPPPPPPPVFSWSGCYIGGYVGGAGMTGCDLHRSGQFHIRGFFGRNCRRREQPFLECRPGQQLHRWRYFGCNWQPVGSPFVLGIEGEAGYMKLEGSAFDPLLNPTLPIALWAGPPMSWGEPRLATGMG